MNNVKKLLAVLIVVTMLVTAMIPVMAADTYSYGDEAIVLNALGLFAGQSDTEFVPDLGSALTREQGVVMLVRLLGSEVDALALTDAQAAASLAIFTDKAEISFWAAKYVAFAVDAGYFIGVGDNKADPKGPLLGKAYATMILRAMGYSVDGTEYNTAALLLYGVDGLSLEESFLFNDKQLIRDDAVGMTYAALSGTMADGGTLIAALVAAGAVSSADAVASGLYTAPVVVPLALEVVSVTASNLKEIVVTFNQAVDATSAKLATNYVVNETAPVSSVMTVASATLSADATSVVLSLKDILVAASDSFSANQASATVKVANVKTVAGAAITTVTKSFTAFDATIPSVVSAVVSGPKKITLTFSEPIETVGTVTLDSGTYYVSVPAIAVGGSKTVDVTVGTTLPAGQHTVVVKDFIDFAGFKVPSTTLSFNYEVNTTVPTVSVKSATETVVTLTFSKNMVETGTINTDFTAYHTYNNVAAYKATLARVSATEYTATFTTPMAPGAQVFFLNATANKFEDEWSNDIATVSSMTVSVVTDTVVPTVASVTATTDKTIVVVFSEDVDSATATTKANYTFLDANGATIVSGHAGLDSAGNPDSGATMTYVAADKKLTILLDTSFAGASYGLKIKAIKDKAFVQNTMLEATFAFSVADSTPPTLTKALVNAARTQVMVYFSEPMSTEGLTTIGNYYYIIDNAAVAAMPASSTVAIIDSKTVKITLGTALAATFVTAADDNIVVSGTLKDATGNALGGLSKMIVTTGDDIAAANISEVKFNSLTNVTFKVDRELSSINVTQFTIDGTALSVTGATYVNGSGVSTVSLTINKAIATDLSGIGANSIVIAASGLTSTFGTANSAPISIGKLAAHDKIAPSLTTKQLTATNTIVMTYSEAIKAASVSIYTYTVAGNTVSNISVAGSAVTLTLGTAVATDATPAVTQALDIEDANGNKLPGSGAVTVANFVAPTVTTVATIATKTVVFTFSEAVYTNSAAPLTDVVIGDFTVTDLAGADIGIATLTVSADKKTVTIVFAGTVSVGDNVSITAASIYDATANVVAAGSTGTF